MHLIMDADETELNIIINLFLEEQRGYPAIHRNMLGSSLMVQQFINEKKKQLHEK